MRFIVLISGFNLRGQGQGARPLRSIKVPREQFMFFLGLNGIKSEEQKRQQMQLLEQVDR